MSVMFSILIRLRSIPALLKILCMIFELIAFICTIVSEKSVQTVEFYCFITGTVIFGLTTLFLVLFLFRIDDFVTVNWAKAEMIFTFFASYIFMLISSLIVRDSDELLMTASICGYLATITLALDMCLMYKLVVSGVNAWGKY